MCEACEKENSRKNKKQAVANVLKIVVAIVLLLMVFCVCQELYVNVRKRGRDAS